MNRIAFLIFCIYYTWDILGQVNLNSGHANLYNPIELNDYLNTPAFNSKVIGLGEATHGTMEFSEIKSDIVKTLIVQYGYKYFILEAGFIDCIKINEFIQNKNDDSLNLFRGLPWPWATTAFYDLIKWMRDYNSHLTNEEAIKFFGSDVGNKGSVRFYRNQFSGTTSGLFVNNVMDIYADTLKTAKQKIALLHEQRKSIPQMTSFMDSMIMINILETLNSLLLKGGAKYAYREKAFAHFTAKLVDHFPPDSKFMLWAHNTHISKYSTSRKTVGYYLDKHYSEKYTNFLFEFNQGWFRAVDIDSNRYRNNVFKFSNFNIHSDFNSFGTQVMPDSLQYIIINVNSPLNRNLVPKTFYIHSIGAVYSIDLAKKKPSLYREKIFRNKSCDYLIVVDQTSASNNFYKQH